MKLFCDLDGVLVLQTGRDNYDSMPWMPDGKTLWEFIAPLRPTVLSVLSMDIFDRCAAQKIAWCARELGSDVPVFVDRAEGGKGARATPGAVLIDDNAARHYEEWTQAGGVFIHHISARDTIERLTIFQHFAGATSQQTPCEVGDGIPPEPFHKEKQRWTQ